MDITARFMETPQRKGHQTRITLRRERLDIRWGDRNVKACQKHRKGETKLHGSTNSAREKQGWNDAWIEKKVEKRGRKAPGRGREQRGEVGTGPWPCFINGANWGLGTRLYCSASPICCRPKSCGCYLKDVTEEMDNDCGANILLIAAPSLFSCRPLLKCNICYCPWSAC